MSKLKQSEEIRIIDTIRLLSDVFLKSLDGTNDPKFTAISNIILSAEQLMRGPINGVRAFAFEGYVVIVNDKRVNWLAADGDGEVWGFEDEPTFCDCDEERCPGSWGIDKESLNSRYTVCIMQMPVRLGKIASAKALMYIGAKS